MSKRLEVNRVETLWFGVHHMKTLGADPRTEPTPLWSRVPPVRVESCGLNIPPQLSFQPRPWSDSVPMGTLAPQWHASFCHCCTYATQGLRRRCWPLLLSTGRILPRRDGEVLRRRIGEKLLSPTRARYIAATTLSATGHKA